jgi:hypothetical protein
MNFLQYFDEFHNEYDALSIMERVFMYDYNMCRSCGSCDTKIFDRTETLSYSPGSSKTEILKEIDDSVTLHCFVCGEKFEDIQNDCFPATDFPLRHFHKLIFLMNKMPELTPESAASILRVDENKVGCMMGILNQHFNRKMIEIVSFIKNITRKDLLHVYLNIDQREMISQLTNTKPDDKTP